MHELILLLLLSVMSELQHLGDCAAVECQIYKDHHQIVHLSFKTTLKIEINPLLFPCGRTGFWKPRQAWLSLVPTWIGDHYALGFVSAPGFLRGQFCVFVGFRDRCGRTLSQQRVPVRWGCSLSDWAWTLTGIIFTQLFPLFLSCSLLVSSSSKCVHGKQCWALAV